jgi:hypothetical protein
VRYLISFLFLLAFAVSNAQVQVRYGATAADTSSASQTHYIYPGTNTIAGTIKFKEAGDLETFVKVDSLSGATAGTVQLQFAYTDEAAPTWYDVGTALTIGSGGTVQWTQRTQTLNFTGLKWRYKIVNSGATQSNRMIAYYTWKRRA